MDHNPKMMLEYCRTRIDSLRAELELLRDMIAYLERRKAGGTTFTPLADVEPAMKEHPH
ncbi:MAG: hypothetical protein HY342_09380 [Candidatus Lambdaproteobacteria bacterium]|nr:hypothetical protein [Candidatus Lambdaproteobacteria bacterium]